MYSTTKLLFEVIITSCYVCTDEYTLHLTSVKIYHLKLLKFDFLENKILSLSWYISKNFYLI